MKLGEHDLNFKLRHCMVYFAHCKPTQQEMDEMEPIILTQGEIPWDPRD